MWFYISSNPFSIVLHSLNSFKAIWAKTLNLTTELFNFFVKFNLLFLKILSIWNNDIY